ncbi:hypothetical protein ACIBEJ_34660 [Nonomuraea sp. NPDC050790]|uniref:hypothetical protein n=1 Tax=Nonomuraea sp. NPDC050790 TaxID=3364371 RepID=UPI0037917B7A
MSEPMLSTDNGTYKVVKTLHRPGGAVDLIVSYRARRGDRVFAAYRREPDGAWKALNGGWSSLDRAVAEAVNVGDYRPLQLGPLRSWLADAIGVTEPSVGGGPDIGDDAERGYRDEQADYDPGTNDEGDEH